MADLTPEARRKATDALLAHVGRRWVVCDHAQILDPAGAVDAVADALDRHNAEEIKRLRAELLAEEGRMLDALDRHNAEEIKRLRAELLAEEGRMLDARDHVNPRSKRYLDDAARRLRALATGLDGQGAGQ